MIFIVGATGFVGRHLVGKLSAQGIPARCLVRSLQKAKEHLPREVETLRGDITDRESLRGKLDGARMVVHLVGIIMEQGGRTFEGVHVKGTANLVEEALSAGVEHIFFQSALGADIRSPFRYLKTKAKAEELVKESGIPYTIFRPSLIIGPGDGFTENMKALLKQGPVVPVPGSGEARFQPIFIGDWVRCFMKVLEDPGFRNRTVEFGGPEQLSYNEILKTMMRVAGTDKPIIHLPVAVTKMTLPFLHVLGTLARKGGFKVPDVSPEQIDLLQMDNIAGKDSVERVFGFKPIGFEDALRQSLSPGRERS